ncbi:MAG: deoxyribose-phosphate aldolase [Actinomycetota bacterium]|jgi:deoxyribose-phosphate aldolase
MDRRAVAQMLDHTLLKPEATPEQVVALCHEAVELQVFAVCVSPSMVEVAHAALVGTAVRTASVVGFPSGAHQAAAVANEAALAVAAGADEIDMVINLGCAKSGDWAAVEAGIAAVRGEVPGPRLLKVIIESAALTNDEIVQACQAAMRANADFVKTSTGFHPTGGATLDAVRLMRHTVGAVCGVKASGGVRTAEVALAMIEAGASRIGTSSSAAILNALS